MNIYEELTRLAETRLAPNSLNHLKIHQMMFTHLNALIIKVVFKVC